MEEKNLKSHDVECPSCGATMKYSPAHKKLRCDNCLTCKDIEFEMVQAKRPWEERNKATRCRDLKGIDTGTVLRSCPGCIEDAVEIVQEVLEL